MRFMDSFTQIVVTINAARDLVFSRYATWFGAHVARSV